MRRLFAGALALGVVAGASAAQTAKTDAASLPPDGVWVKLQETLDTSYTRASDKISAVLQTDATVGNTKLPKGTQLLGTVVKAVKQDKQHPNAGMVLLFDTAVLKGGNNIPVHASILSLAPSHASEIEHVDVGSGDITDASLAADIVAGKQEDANPNVTAKSGTTVNGRRATSSINGVVLFAAKSDAISGTVVARTGGLVLDKWTRMDVVLTAK